jgi:hypothetical protein
MARRTPRRQLTRKRCFSGASGISDLATATTPSSKSAMAALRAIPLSEITGTFDVWYGGDESMR